MSDNAASPSEASATTFKPRSSSTLSRNPFRISGWSSAIRIRISSSTTLVPHHNPPPTYHVRRSLPCTSVITIAARCDHPDSRTTLHRSAAAPLSSRAYPDFLLHRSHWRPLMWFSLKRTTCSRPKPQLSTENPGKPRDLRCAPRASQIFPSNPHPSNRSVIPPVPACRGTGVEGRAVAFRSQTKPTPGALSHVEPHGPMCSILYILCSRAFIRLNQGFR